MEQTHKVIFIILAVLVLAVMLGVRSIPRPAPTLATAKEDDPNAVRLGDSGRVGATTRGPTYLTVNVPLFYPPPLAHLNPVTAGPMS